MVKPEWLNESLTIQKHDINQMRFEFVEVRDNKGNLKETRISKIYLEKLEDVLKTPFGENILFRATIEPIVFFQPPANKDSVTGFLMQKESVQMSPLLKEIDIKFNEIQKALDKAQKKSAQVCIFLQMPLSPVTKIDNAGTPEEKRTTFYKIKNKDVSAIEIL